MSEHDNDRDDSRLSAALRAALEQRDRAVRPPHFASMWTDRSERHRPMLPWRPLVASVVCALAVVGIVWKSTEHPARLDPVLAHRLSSAEYWRVPTDDVLVYEAAPLSADLPSPTGLTVSLEESLL